MAAAGRPPAPGSHRHAEVRLFRGSEDPDPTTAGRQWRGEGDGWISSGPYVPIEAGSDSNRPRFDDRAGAPLRERRIYNLPNLSHAAAWSLVFREYALY